MKYFCVTQKYYDNGKTWAAVTGSVEADRMPESEYKSLSKFDLYKDYFESVEEAKQYAADTLKA